MNPSHQSRVDANTLRQFVAIVALGGFRPAARRLGITPSALSHAMRRLEADLGARLLHRSSRSVRPTGAGAALYARIAPAFREIEDAVGATADRGPGGVLRLNAPRLAALTLLGPRLPAFHEAHPAIRIEVTVEDRAIDIVAEGYDAGVRFGRVLQPDVIGVPVGRPQDFVAAASPDYLARAAPLPDPAALGVHLCVAYRLADGRIFPWVFERDGRRTTFLPDDRLVLSDPLLTRDAALAGAGVVYTATAFLDDDLARGRLVRVLDGWRTPVERLHVYYAGRRHVPPALRAFIDWLATP
jgi:DNA-binding transcriptional LysR family regulator